MKLQGLFRELFQLDMVDLDFGLYRLFNIKRQEIEDFLTKQLPDEVDEEKAKHAAAKRWVSAVNTWGDVGQ
jgi:adenine-specific DNA-methyltransferase